MWWGLTGAESVQQMDGTLVFGGYDAAKLTGDNVTQPLTIDQGCISALTVTVTDIVMDFVNGSHKSIFGPQSGSALRMCIQPQFPTITVPSSIWDAFVNASGKGDEIGRALGISGYGMLYPPNNV